MISASTALILVSACGGGSSGAGGASSAGGGGSSTNCRPAHSGLTTVTPGSLTVATYPYPPFASVSNGKLSGAEGVILNKIAAMECLKIGLVQGSSAAMIPSVVSGRADTTSGDWYRTKARAAVVRLGAPVLQDELTLVSKAGVPTVQALKGRQVGSLLGFLWNDDLKKLLGSNLHLYQDTQAEYADLKAGRISVVVDTYPSAVQTLKKDNTTGMKLIIPPKDSAVESTVKPGQSMFPVNKKNTKLGDAINADIKKLRSSGELAKLIAPFGFGKSAANPGTPTIIGCTGTAPQLFTCSG